MPSLNVSFTGMDLGYDNLNSIYLKKGNIIQPDCKLYLKHLENQTTAVSHGSGRWRSHLAHFQAPGVHCRAWHMEGT
jgi:hypothetical protein